MLEHPEPPLGHATVQVYCSFREAGYEWEGHLGALAEHLNDDIKSDSYKSTGCPFLQLKCGEELKRQCVLEHKENKCMKRPYKCNTCNEFESTYEGVTTEHISVCPCGLVPCPNDYGVVEIQRKSVADHLATVCPLEMVSCSFRYAGCEEKLPCKDMAAHTSDSLAVHMSPQAVNHQKELSELKTAHQKKIKELKTELKELKNDSSK